MSLKTNSSFGVVFYVSDKDEKNYMVAFLAHGKLVYTFNVDHHRIKIKSPQNLNDGAWHDVRPVLASNGAALPTHFLRL